MAPVELFLASDDAVRATPRPVSFFRFFLHSLILHVSASFIFSTRSRASCPTARCYSTNCKCNPLPCFAPSRCRRSVSTSALQCSFASLAWGFPFSAACCVRSSLWAGREGQWSWGEKEPQNGFPTLRGDTLVPCGVLLCSWQGEQWALTRTRIRIVTPLRSVRRRNLTRRTQASLDIRTEASLASSFSSFCSFRARWRSFRYSGERNGTAGAISSDVSLYSGERDRTAGTTTSD